MRKVLEDFEEVFEDYAIVYSGFQIRIHGNIIC
jgi:hypothetical protein